MLRFAFRSTVFASLLLTTALVLPTAASEPFKPEGWQTGVMRKPDGSFAYCVSESKFEQNLWIILALTPTGDVNLGVGQKGANLPVGDEKPVRIRVDGNPPQEMTARAVKPELMVINVGQSSRLLEMISRGNMMNVDNMSFSLAGSGKAVETLRECVQASAGSAPAVTLNGAPVVAPAPAIETPVAQAPAVEAPAPAPAAVAAAPVEVAPPIVQSPVRADIKWNPSPIAMPGQRDANTLPPSMQQAQAELPVPAAVAAAETPAPAAPVEAAPAVETVIASTSAPIEATAPVVEAPVPAAPAATIDQAGLAPELIPPTPDTRIVTVPAPQTETAPAAEVAAAVPEPVLPASAPLATPAIKPLPAQLERLLTTANLREVEAAPVTENDIAFAWKSRDMLGNVREVAVPAGSNIVQLAGQHFSMLKARCDVQFSASLGQPQNTGALQILTGSTTCRGNGKSHYTTLVFALSQQGVLSIIANNIDQGRRAAPDRAQSGIVEALKATQG